MSVKSGFTSTIGVLLALAFWATLSIILGCAGCLLITQPRDHAPVPTHPKWGTAR